MNAFERLFLMSCLLFSTAVFGQIESQAKQGHNEVVQFRNSPLLPQIPGYSHAAIVNGGKLIFVSGQVGLNKAGEVVGKDDFHGQATQAFANLNSALAAAGAGPHNLVKLTFYVVGLNKERLQILRTVRDTYIDKNNPPTSTLAGVAALFREDCLIEVEAVAVIP